MAAADLLKTRLDTTREAGLKLANEYDALCADRQKTYPILATFTTGSGAAEQLEDLASNNVGDMATKVATVANEKLENIAKVRGELGGRFSVWKEPHLRELTKQAMTVASWQSRHGRAEIGQSARRGQRAVVQTWEAPPPDPVPTSCCRSRRPQP